MEWKRRGKDIGMPLNDYLAQLITDAKNDGITLSCAVGTDSQRNGRGYKFATVIVMLKTRDLGGGLTKSEGGMMVYRTFNETVYKKGKEGVNQRMITEVGKSIEVAYEIADMLDSYGIKLEIHADINPDPRWESNKAMNEAIGWILGMGYDFKIKPNAHAASFSADKYCA